MPCLECRMSVRIYSTSRSDVLTTNGDLTMANETIVYSEQQVSGFPMIIILEARDLTIITITITC